MSEIESDYLPRATRFAPSPSGRLHLGHVYSALFAQRQAEEIGGTFLLRIEDIDLGRCKPEYEQAIYDDLTWLGLTWPQPVLRQSERFPLYDKFLHILEEGGLTYPCFCTRKDILREIEDSPRASHGPDGPVYPGICKSLSGAEAEDRIAAGEAHAIRLDMTKATRMTGPLSFTDLDRGQIAVDALACGDVVLARKDIPTTYHLSVTVDDALQHISVVTRGEDLLHATPVHRVLQTLLGLPEPQYRHHKLLLDDEGNRLAKRDLSVSLETLRDSGVSPEEIRARVGFPA